MTIPNVYIFTIGGSPEPIINAVEINKPDYIYFLCSGGKKESSSVSIVTDKIVPELDETTVQYDIETVLEPDDLSAVLAKCKSIHKKMNLQFPSGCYIIANYTGGTKTMALGLGVYALQYPNWTLQVNTITRTDLIKVKSGDVSLKLDVSEFHFHRLEHDIELMEKQEEFEYAKQRVKQFGSGFQCSFNMKERLTAWHQEFEVLSLWDRFEYNQACDLAKNPESAAHKYLPVLKDLKNISDAMNIPEPVRFTKKGKKDFAMVEDVIKNAERCAKQSRYDDAVCRLYRAAELLAQTQLLRKYEIITDNIKFSHPKFTPEIQDWLKMKAKGKEYQTGLMDSFELLNKLNDTLGQYFHKNSDHLRKYLDARNKSFFAHGFVPINKDVWRNTGKKWLSWIREAIEAAYDSANPERDRI